LNFIKFVIIIRIWSISTTTKEINKEIEKFYSSSAAVLRARFNNPPITPPIAPTIVYATITIMMAMTPVAIPSASSSSDSN